MTIKYRPITQKEFQKNWSDCGMTLEQLNEERRVNHELLLGIAQGLVVAYVGHLAATGNDRDAVDRVREIMRADEQFFDVAGMIAELTEGNMHWHYSVIRSEARATERGRAEHFEQLRAQRLAEKEAARLAEIAEVEALPNFGMF